MRFLEGRLLLAGVLTVLVGAPRAGSAAERRWTFQFENVFRGGAKPLLIYARESGGRWIAGVGSSRDPYHKGSLKKTYNRSWYYADMSGVPIADGKVQGVIKLHMTPDLWVPRDHKGFTIDLKIDAALEGSDNMRGTFQILAVHSRDVSVRDLGREGAVKAAAQSKEQAELPDAFTLTCNLQGALVGGDPGYGNRCMILSLGLRGGKLVAAARAAMDKKLRAFGRKGFPVAGSTAAAGRDRFTAHVAVPAKTLDMEPCTYVFDIDGYTYDEHLVGTYALTVKIDGKADAAAQGSFDGKVEPGVRDYPSGEDGRPWFTRVRGFQPVGQGEHPRLLFREGDLPALREKARTPEGQEILKRLRYLLDGKDGETMTSLFSGATHAYMGGGYKNTTLDRPGAYTFSHAAGYGLLYQLTGEKKYAEFGRQCFQEALEGVRDRDDRYSFRKPGGALRAGPTLGWYAVGFDLCYDGWDPAAREEFGRAIAEYTSNPKGEFHSGDKKIDLEALARGTMPPSSNHFGMQVGGASLALLAVSGEKWVDQDRIDTLLAIAREGMIRNLGEGFGDGGFFAEGDGTGSMSSHIAFLSALQAWKNARGLDFFAVQRPNARMIALKWIYLTVVRDGRIDFWPVRGAYGHNVWSRRSLSGGGYFAIGTGGLGDDGKAAMKWYYNRFLGDADARAGAPFDTTSPYPHVAVCAFVNWPLRLKARNPGGVLSHCYRDTFWGFHAWRNRWQDADDTVISVLTRRTQGYMSAKPDRSLCLVTHGRHLRWGTVREGPARYWRASPKGETSSLTLSDGTCFAVDFTGASGADVMLVTTGKAEGKAVNLAGKTLTFYFPTAQSVPDVAARGDAAVAGGQRVTLKDGNLAFEVAGR